MHNVSLSTMWGVGRFDHMADFVSRGKALGFCCFELNHQVTPVMLDELLTIYQRGGMTISSIHDPCPNGENDTASKPKVSDLDESGRQAAVALAKSTMDLAVQVQAQAVVLHIGDVPETWDQEKALRRLYREGKRNTPEYRALLSAFEQTRSGYAPAHLDAVARSLEELIVYARRRGLRLGLENRYYATEIPWVGEVAWLLERFGDGVAGYWHDVGHAEALERLGFARHQDWLTALGDRIVGVHLHDMEGISDHKAAGLGDIDLGMVCGYLPPNALRVCEFNNQNSEDQVAAGLERLSQLGYFS